MKNIRSNLFYKLLREVKNTAIQLYTVVYWQAINAASMLKDHFRDKSLGIDTYGWIAEADESLHRDMILYMPIPYGKIQSILDYLRPGKEDVFIDFGSGKGRAVFMAAARGIRKAVGVELNKSLIADARENLRTVKGLASPVEFVNQDAATFEISEGTIFFLYNPFGYKTTAAVADNIKKFLSAGRKNGRIVYLIPQHRHIFDDSPWLELEKDLNNGEVLVWRSRI